MKRIGGPDQILDSRRYEKLQTRTYKKILMGHTRAATQGEISEDNAHPFLFTNVVGAHNGTIPPHIKKKLPYHELYETDSEAIYSAISDKGEEAVINLLTDGAYALTWFDRVNDKLKFIRNKERPLFYAYTKSKDCIFWASDISYLKFVGEKNDIQFSSSKETKEPTIYDVTVDKLLQWDIPKDGKPFDSLKISDLKPPEVKHKYSQPDYYNESEWGNGFRSYRSQSHSRGWTSNGGSSPQQSEENKETVKLLPSPQSKLTERPAANNSGGSSPYLVTITRNGSLKQFVGWNGERLNEHQFSKRTKKGCSWCGQDVTFGQWIRFVAHDKYLCEDCREDDGVAERVCDGTFDLVGDVVQPANLN